MGCPCPSAFVFSSTLLTSLSQIYALFYPLHATKGGSCIHLLLSHL